MATTHKKETLRQIFTEVGVKINRLKKRRVPEASPSSSPVIPDPADSASLCIRLVDTRSSKLISTELRKASTYIAISHVWAENLFPVAQKNDIGKAVGYHMITAALEQLCPLTHHIWVDTWCIDQNDSIDKHRQIRSMGDIYRTADFVLITLSHNLNQTQGDLDDIMSKLSKAADMLDYGEVWDFRCLEYLGSAEVVEPLVRGFAFLQSLMQSTWPTRLWCFQEAALAKKILWIGLDRVPLHISDMTLVAILDLPFINTQLQERLGPHLKSSRFLLKPLLDHRLGWTDPTCVMEAAYLRESTIQEDEIYGLMGASGVTIEPDPTKTLEMLWKRWWEETISLGHIRWLMLSWESGYPNLDDMGYTRTGCVVPPSRKRSTASSLSGLHNCGPYGAVNVGEDCVKVPGYCVGTCSSFVHLGSATKASDVHSCWMTVAGLGRGDLDLTMRIVAAMWFNPPFEMDLWSISNILCSEYLLSSAHIKSKSSLHDLRQSFDDRQYKLLNELSQDICTLWGACGLDLYLTTIENNLRKTNVIVQASEPIAPGEFLALDLNAKNSDWGGSRVLMIAQTVREATTDKHINSSEPSSFLHKAGITMRVRLDETGKSKTGALTDTWNPSSLEHFTFPLSRASCSVCHIQDNTALKIRQWLDELHGKGVEQIFLKDIHMEHQRRFGRGQVEFLPDVKDRAVIDEVFYRNSEGGYSNERRRIGGQWSQAES